MGKDKGQSSGNIGASHACYAVTIAGLEEVAAGEIADRLGAEVKRTAPGLVVFRPPAVDRALLTLRCVEDVFLLLWGSDQLTYRAADLELIEKWTRREPDWARALQLHHQVHKKPGGKPTYRLVTQLRGEHGYRRVDAAKAFARGMAGRFPASWKPADEGASVEVWLTIHGKRAVCGLRLSDKTMRHRTYKEGHMPASLRPVAAACMVRLAGAKHGMRLLDPMCGTGTILAEQLLLERGVTVLGGDIDHGMLHAAHFNLHRLVESPPLARWNASRLPLRPRCIDRIACNLPFGVQIGKPEEMAELYRNLLYEWRRVLKPGARVVLLAADWDAVREPAGDLGWRCVQRLSVFLLGQRAVLSVWEA